MKCQVGRIEVSMHFIEKPEEHAPTLTALFSQFYPVHIDFQVWNRKVVYTGYSPAFEEVGEGMIPPDYIATCKRDEGDTVSVSFDRIEFGKTWAMMPVVDGNERMDAAPTEAFRADGV